MGFLYPRTVSVTRLPAATAAAGIVGYQASQKSAEQPIASGLPANIQIYDPGKSPLGDLPAGTTGRGFWKIFIPAGAAAVGLILDNDLVTDDLGQRYKVLQAYWNGLGYQLRCERMRAG